MKLQKEYDSLLPVWNRNSTAIKGYAEKLKEQHNYNNYEKRLAWDILRFTVPVGIICSWYDEYNCTDEHITTLAIKLLHTVL